MLAWLLNVATSVAIVFVNKLLMDPKRGHKFVFATTLCAFHFFTSAFTVKTFEALGFEKPAKLPLRDTLIFSLMGGTSIAALNLSLLLNTVGFYQITKLLIIPFVCLVEFAWMGRSFRRPLLLAILVVIMGVGIVTVTDMSGGKLSLLGMIVAGVSVVSSGLQQILCGVIQRRNGVSSNQMLSNTAPIQGMILLAVGPFLDHAVSNKWIMNYQVSVPAIQCLALSCAIAALVNISQFMCLGRFNAITFQVTGHTKTVLVLLMGWLLLGDVITGRKLLGIILAVMGMIWYAYLASQPTEQPVVSNRI